MEMVPISVVEKWYLRLILLNMSPISFKDAKKFEGREYKTFQITAIAANLVKDNNEAITAFTWAMEHSTPAELRNLFSILTIQGFPTINIYNDEICQIKLMEDFLINHGLSGKQR